MMLGPMRLVAGLALALTLSGCVAFAALPVLAGGAMFAGGNVRIGAATPRPKKAATLAPRLAAEQTAGMPVVAGTSVVLTTLTALPPPDSTSAGLSDPWQRFFDFAAARAAGFAQRPAEKSALLAAGDLLQLPRMRDCAAQIPAVIIDLDVGEGMFAPVQGQTAAPALVEGLARLRAAGAAVVWLSSLPATRVGEVAETLRASGLDPEGRDPLLLVRAPDDRKQALREEANRDVCVIAIAGDRRGDFDELFDYLRDPRAGDALDFLIGSGWFLVPPPLN